MESQLEDIIFGCQRKLSKLSC